MDAPCPERARLQRQYESAVNDFGKASRWSARHLTQKTSESWQHAQKALLDHEREHGCGRQQSEGLKRPDKQGVHKPPCPSTAR
jgi:hypothetical protein